MPRRNLLRSWLAVSLLALTGATPLLVGSPTPAAAADNNPVYVRVSDQAFTPAEVTVRPGDRLYFLLADGASDQHTITSDDNGSCPIQPGAPCWQEESFATRRERFIRFNVGDFVGEFPYYDRFSRAAGGNMGGKIIVIKAAPPPATQEPTSSTTVVPPSTTSTTQPVTTTTAQTTTTAPTPVRPLLISAPPPTTTTTAAPNLPATPAPAKSGAVAASDANKGKDKGKNKAASPQTPTTASPTPPDAVPPDAVFDPASLTPGPLTAPDAPAPDPEDDANLESAAVVNLLDRDEPDDDRPMLLALGILAFLLFMGGVWGWLHRASRYDPA